MRYFFLLIACLMLSGTSIPQGKLQNGIKHAYPIKGARDYRGEKVKNAHIISSNFVTLKALGILPDSFIVQ